MTGRKRVVLTPQYLNNFACTGSACEDSCCVGWRVDLDKQTYLHYTKSQNQELKPLFQKAVTRKHNGKSDGAYGKIKMEKNGHCPFLSKGMLCKIQLEMGEGALSDTCALYPRQLNQVDGKFERSATMSCPEVVRLALLNADGIIFEQSEEDSSLRYKLQTTFDTEGHLYLRKPQRYFWEIRMFALSLLQDRQYLLADRLILLGMFYQKLEKLAAEKRTRQIPALIESFTSLIESERLKEELAAVPAQLGIQMKLAKELTDIKVRQGVASKRYLECLNETLLGIDCVDEENIEKMAAKYEENYHSYLKPYLQEKEYILENYLVNEYYKELMPFGSFSTIWDSYIFLCALYGMLKLHLAGMSGYHKGLTDELTVKLIQSFSKVVLHNRPYILNIIRLITENNFNSLAHMAILVKN